MEATMSPRRLCPPKPWPEDRARRKRCGIPGAVHDRTRHELSR